MYGYGTRSCTDGRNNMWALRSLWGGSNYTRFRSQHWCWDPEVPIAEGVMNRWSHVFHIYTGTNVQVYVDNVSRADWTRTEISTGENHGVQIGRFSDEALQRRTFKGKISDFRIYDQALSSGDRAIIYNNGNGENLTPVSITSALEVNATLNSAFSYTITADDPNAVLNAIGLPQGLTVNQTTGLISGTPTIGGSYSVSLSAETSASTDAKTLTINLPVSALNSRSMIRAWFMPRPRGLPARFLRREARPLPFPCITGLRTPGPNLAKYGKPWKQVGRTILERPGPD